MEAAIKKMFTTFKILHALLIALISAIILFLGVNNEKSINKKYFSSKLKIQIK